MSASNQPGSGPGCCANTAGVATARHKATATHLRVEMAFLDIAGTSKNDARGAREVPHSGFGTRDSGFGIRDSTRDSTRDSGDVTRVDLFALLIAEVQADNRGSRREDHDGSEEQRKHQRSNPKTTTVAVGS